MTNIMSLNVVPRKTIVCRKVIDCTKQHGIKLHGNNLHQHKRLPKKTLKSLITKLI